MISFDDFSERKEIAGHWPCRNTRCRKPVGVTQIALDQWAAFNNILRARDEHPLNTAEIVFCDGCRVFLVEKLAKDSAYQADKMAKLIRELKEMKPGWDRMDEIYKELEKLKHGDIKGLREAVAANAGKGEANKTDRKWRSA